MDINYNKQNKYFNNICNSQLIELIILIEDCLKLYDIKPSVTIQLIASFYFTKNA